MYHYSKKVLNIEEKIKSYEDAGMELPSREKVETALKDIGYYRLRGYSFHLYDNAAKKYKEGTRFENILKIYYFDQELSDIVFSIISKIEVALRVRLVDSLLSYEDALILQDVSIFENKKMYWQNMSSVASEISRSNDVFIKHNFDNHDGAIPVWAVVEVLSFGTLSKIISNLKTGKDSAFSILAEEYKYTSIKGNLVKPSKKMFDSWVKSVSIMRNMCAHNARIYNRTIHTAPEILYEDKCNPAPKNNGLYQILLAMKYIRSSDHDWMNFFDKLRVLISDNADVINLSSMNFPNDWEAHLRV